MSEMVDSLELIERHRDSKVRRAKRLERNRRAMVRRANRES